MEGWERGDDVLDSQETGILFAELCVRRVAQRRLGVGIVLPNGYLGNRSQRYSVFSETGCCVTQESSQSCQFAYRFTFKKSGADVSASLLFLEKEKSRLGFRPKASSMNFMWAWSRQ